MEKHNHVDVALGVTAGKDGERTVFVNPQIAVSAEYGCFYKLIIKSASKEIRLAISEDSKLPICCLCEKLNKLIKSNTRTDMIIALQDEGLNYTQARIALKHAKDGWNLLLELEIGLQGPVPLIDYIRVHFIDNKGRRISSIKTTHPYNQKLFGKMKIDSDAGHRTSDEYVLRDIHCRYCYRIIATGTIEELSKTGELKDICDSCRDWITL